MDHRKLFQVLVIGGALLGGGGCTEATPEDEEDPLAPDAGVDEDGATADGSPAVDSATTADGSIGDAMPGELEGCGFCPNECCVTDEETGESREREGFMCCWGTSC